MNTFSSKVNVAGERNNNGLSANPDIGVLDLVRYLPISGEASIRYGNLLSYNFFQLKIKNGDTLS